MWGDQLVRPWWLLRDIAASPDGLTIGRDCCQKPVPKPGMGFFVFGDRQRFFFSALRTQHSALFSGKAVSVSLMAGPDRKGR
jgi:hypothetical protein